MIRIVLVAAVCIHEAIAGFRADHEAPQVAACTLHVPNAVVQLHADTAGSGRMYDTRPEYPGTAEYGHRGVRQQHARERYAPLHLDDHLAQMLDGNRRRY